MDLKDKKVLFLGDSITFGVGVSSPEKKYVELFAKETGAHVKNYGISATRISRMHIPSANPDWDQCFLDRVELMDNEADIVVVFGGTNDFGHGDGGLGVFHNNDEHTFYGAMHSLIKRLVNKYPYATIIFITPLHRTDEDILVYEPKGTARPPLKLFVNAIKEVCEYYSIPVLDLYANLGVQPSIPIMQELYMPDGLHPSDLGARRIADRLIAFFKTI